MPAKTKFYTITLLFLYKCIRGVILFFMRNNHHEFKANKMFGLKQLRISPTRTLIPPECIQTVRSGCVVPSNTDLHQSAGQSRPLQRPRLTVLAHKKTFITRARFPPDTVSAAPKCQCHINARPEWRRPLTGAGIEVARQPREHNPCRFPVRATAPHSNDSPSVRCPYINDMRLSRKLFRHHTSVHLPPNIDLAVVAHRHPPAI